VNVLFDGWLRNLRKQGDVEVLDPALETPETAPGAGPSTSLPHPIDKDPSLGTPVRSAQDDKGGA
jgi:hypothetical protein